MKGTYDFEIRSKRLLFKFQIKRNITILKGDSGVGKTTLLEMLNSYLLDGRDSGFTVSTNANYAVYLRDFGNIDWLYILQRYTNNIIFIEENNNFIFTHEFAEFVKNSGNYFVIVNRKPIKTLPYSYTEIYTITENKYNKTFQRVFEFKNIYSLYDSLNKHYINDIVTEDSNSGFTFFKHLFYNKQILKSEGNAKIIKIIKESITNKLIIADGAAFGAYIEECIYYINQLLNISLILWLPESFEWLLLKSKVINFKGLDQILENPSDYIECSKYVSWERFFTDLAIKYSNDKFKYLKSRLDNFYINARNIGKVKSILPKEICEILNNQEQDDQEQNNQERNKQIIGMNLF